MKEISNAEQQNLNWLWSVLNSDNYTERFKYYAYKNILKFEQR